MPGLQGGKAVVFPGGSGGKIAGQQQHVADSCSIRIRKVVCLSCWGLFAIFFALINNELHLLIEVSNQWSSLPGDKCCQCVPFAQISFD